MNIRHILFVAALFCTAAFAAPASRPPVVGSWQLRYAEEFDGSGADLQQRGWMTLRGSGDGYRAPFNPDLDDAAFDSRYATLQNGNLRLRWAPVAITDGGRSYPYTAGIATTASGFSFRYGLIEARIWLPSAAGIAPAFWLLPSPVDSAWPPEVDIAEFSTTERGQVDAHFNVHYRQGGRLRQIYGFPAYGENVGGAWHIYTLDWRSDSMTMLLDGRTVYRYTGAGIPAVPMYIVFSAGVLKGQRPGAGNMLVDYVRVWQ